MRLLFWMTVTTGSVVGVATSLLKEAETIRPETARLLLIALVLFLFLEWGAHLVGSRIGCGWAVTGADRAAFASLSSAGIWIVLLSSFPMVLERLGFQPVSPHGIAVMTAAASVSLYVRLWFLREIYQVNFASAARVWMASRGAAFALGVALFALWAVTIASEGQVPVLRMGF